MTRIAAQPDTDATAPTREIGSVVVPGAAPQRSRLAFAVETLAAVALGLLVVVVHRFGYLMHHPYWADEAWVATLSKAPTSQFVSLSSSTPLAWLLLVRWVPAGRDGLRIVPAVFGGAAVVMAYIVARSLPWRTPNIARFAGTTTALTVLVAPVSLLRNDLKQYTADSFFALAIIAVGCRAEADPSLRRLAALAALAVIAMPFSAVSTFVAAAVFTGLFLAAIAARSVGRAHNVVITGVSAAVGVGAYFATVVIPHDNRPLRDYWRPYYLSGTPSQIAADSWDRIHRLAPLLAMPAVVFAGLFVLGVAVIFRLGRPALAIAVVVLWAEMVAAGMLRWYPFLDERTSYFVLVVSITVVALGATGAIVAIGRRSRISAGVVAVAVAATFAGGATDYLRVRSLPNEDIRSQVLYVAEHRNRNDVVLVSAMSSYGFSYYWPGARVEYRPSQNASNGYVPYVANLPEAVYASGRNHRDTNVAMRRALALAYDSGHAARIWLIRTHVSAEEARAWAETFHELGVHPSTIAVGLEPLALVTPER